MQPTLALCRTQEAHQRALASSATLDNVKRVANAAAAAWAKEGHAAEQRETRKLHAREFAEQLGGDDAILVDESLFGEDSDHGVSHA